MMDNSKTSRYNPSASSSVFGGKPSDSSAKPDTSKLDSAREGNRTPDPMARTGDLSSRTGDSLRDSKADFPLSPGGYTPSEGYFIYYCY